MDKVSDLLDKIATSLELSSEDLQSSNSIEEIDANVVSGGTFAERVSELLNERDKRDHINTYSPMNTIHEVSDESSLGVFPLSQIQEESSFNINVDHIIQGLEDESLTKDDINNIVFNDTLEKVDYMLNNKLDDDNQLEGKSYDVPTTNRNVLPINPQTKQPKERKKKNKYENILSPVACYIKSTPTRVSTKNEHLKVTTPTLTKTVKDDYKNILSPVGVYIKNSPYTPLKQNVITRNIDKENFLISNCNNDNTPIKDFESVKQTMYRPANIKHVVKNEVMKLPKGVNKMISSPSEIIKHKQIKANCVNVDKTLDGDLTAMAKPNGDISVLTTKTHYIK